MKSILGKESLCPAKSVVSKRVKEITPSLVFAICEKANKMKADGKDIVNFSVGEPDFGTPDYVIEAAGRAMNEGKTKYTETGGVLPLRKAVCEKLKSDSGLDYTPEQIVVSNGSKHSLFNTLSCLVDPGDEVIIFAPYWLTYPEVVKICGGVPVIVDNKKKLASAITSKTKVIIINSPNNPSGEVLSKAQITEMAAVIEKHDVWVISDEIYEKLIYDMPPGSGVYSIAAHSKRLYERTIIINGLSKAYAMTGWRVGFSASSVEIAKAIRTFQSHTLQSVSAPNQYAAAEALSNPKAGQTVANMVKQFKERRDYMLERLGNMPHIKFTKPQGAFYVLIDVRKLGYCAKDVADELLEKSHLAVTPCEAFGLPGYIRLSYALSMNEIKKGLDRLEKFLTDSRVPCNA